MLLNQQTLTSVIEPTDVNICYWTNKHYRR